jgi:hypothetical protein
MNGDYLVINGEQIDKHEARCLVQMLYNDAKQIAGVFHGMNRSAKFRANWPDEYLFAETNWKNFVEAARQMYAAELGKPKVSESNKRKMHLALVIEAEVSKGEETDTRLQLFPGTQQYEGDPFENRKILDQFGKHSNTFKELLLGSSSRRFDA